VAAWRECFEAFQPYYEAGGAHGIAATRVKRPDQVPMKGEAPTTRDLLPDDDVPRQPEGEESKAPKAEETLHQRNSHFQMPATLLRQKKGLNKKSR